MSIASIDQLKTLLSISLDDTLDDDDLEQALNAAEDAVRLHCGRSFNIASEATKLYTGDGSDELQVDDIATPDNLLVEVFNGNGWDDVTANVVLEDLNAEHDGKPYTTVALITGTFPTTRGGVRINANFGWTEVPAAVVRATLLLAAKLWKRKDATFGVIAGPELSAIRIGRQDYDVTQLLSLYVKSGNSGIVIL